MIDSRRSTRIFLWRVFLVALALRLVPVLLSYNLGIGLDDMFQYDMLARSLVSGNGYRWYAQDDLRLVQQYLPLDLSTMAYDPRGVLTAFRPPLYPAFLALVYSVLGLGLRRFFFTRLVQAVLGSLLPLLTFLLAVRLFPDRPRASRLAAWVVVLYPMLILFPLALATENLFIFLVLASVLVLLRGLETRRSMDFVWFGFLAGMSALTRSVILFAFGLCLLWIWFSFRERRKALLALIALAVTIAPWIIRNSLLFHRPAGIEVSLGYNLYMGYHPQSSGTFKYGISLDLLPILDDDQRDRLGTQAAVAFIKDNPTRMPSLMVSKLGYFFGLERRALTYFYSNDFFGYLPLPILLLIGDLVLVPFGLVSTSAALGLGLVRWDYRVWLLVLVLFGYVLPHLLLLAEERFHLVLVPFLAVLAAQLWDRGWNGVSERWRTRVGKLALIVAGMVVVLLCLNWGLELWRDADKLALLFGPNGNRTFFPY
jgi:hypothetical protein